MEHAYAKQELLQQLHRVGQNPSRLLEGQKATELSEKLCEVSFTLLAQRFKSFVIQVVLDEPTPVTHVAYIEIRFRGPQETFENMSTFSLLMSPYFEASLYPVRFNDHERRVSSISRHLGDLALRDKEKGFLTLYSTVTFAGSLSPSPSLSDGDDDSSSFSSDAACSLSLRCPLYENSEKATIEMFYPFVDQAKLYSLATELGYAGVGKVPHCIREGAVKEYVKKNFPEVVSRQKVSADGGGVGGRGVVAVHPAGTSPAPDSFAAASADFWSEVMSRTEDDPAPAPSRSSAKREGVSLDVAWCACCSAFCGGKSEDRPMVRCVGCGPTRRYCSKKCRDQDWKEGHKDDCTKDYDEREKAKETEVEPRGRGVIPGDDEQLESFMPPWEIVPFAICVVAFFMYRAYQKSKFLASELTEQEL